MKKYLSIICMILMSCFSINSFAANNTATNKFHAETELFPIIDNQVFSKKTIPGASDNDKRIIFFRETESSELWSQLVEYHYKHLPDINNDPQILAKQLAESIQSLNKEIQYSISQDKKTGATILTYIMWHKEMPYQELHVYRFDRATDGKSIYGLQIVKRSETGEPMEQAITGFKEIQPSWLKQAEQFNMQKIINAFR